MIKGTTITDTFKATELLLWNTLQTYDYYTSDNCKIESPQLHQSKIDDIARKIQFNAYHKLRSKWSKLADVMHDKGIDKDYSDDRLQYNDLNSKNVMTRGAMIKAFHNFDVL
tara:strand:+ start:9287 stop:9622 length:336 start_codon:yes stop_codon:yes gene_type:complete